MIERLAVAAADAAAIAAHVRGYVPEPGSVAERVSGIVESVREGGDAALIAHERRFGGARRSAARARRGAARRARRRSTAPSARGSSWRARTSPRVAEAGLFEDRDVELPQGQRIRLREIPVARAAVYAPGGRQPYPSSVVMGVVTARAAGVREVVVAAAGAPGDPRRRARSAAPTRSTAWAARRRSPRSRSAPRRSGPST